MNYYEESYALIIGVNSYVSASPLQYAVHDAEAVASLLIDNFEFASENVRVLLDDQAAGSAISREYLSFATQEISSDSRLVVYFAGHGHTLTSRRGEVGFLVPHDGDLTDLSTLIRWDQITKAADLIPSKHILYLMDACYGGLAITRSMQPGASRFLVDMLSRHSRQVITAGKADELVADLGGPLPNHSVFTGHLIEGLSGGAADSEGILTANGVMAYVYRHVGQDPDSSQTPHFGYLDGDGDLIFEAPILAAPEDAQEEGGDVLFAIPAVAELVGGSDEMTVVDRTKELLSDPKNRIHLHDLVVEATRNVMGLTDDEAFPMQGTWSVEEFADRLNRYERYSEQLMSISSLMGYWAAPEFREISSIPVRRLAGRIQAVSGLNVWTSARWYPILLLTYSYGISAVAASNYQALFEYFHVPVENPRARKEESLILSVIAGVGDLSNAFKSLPGHEKQYTPHSEYLFKLIQPMLDDLLFLGAEYESHFDRFDIILALEHTHLNEISGGSFWGPVGRFGWKHHRGDGSPLSSCLEEAQRMKDQWPPILSGFFGGSFDRFQVVSEALAKRIGNLGWF